ncbi:glycosyltransferase family A protein [Pseudomonas sp. RL]|uniref:glycosyltransferase family 2 protein n=1 Tax=Pseudomonas sp. RL TaxID=1452718 RepID=UPI000480B61A|nr:glycosyltransferase family A protein [Pseudomonas sp. RL]
MNENKGTPGKLVSVVIPAYNYAKTLERAAESVIGQLDESSELIIIDDGSKDETPEVMQRLAERHPGKFIGIRKENGGLASVRNRGIAEGRGDYLIFLDADDEMAPGALAAIRQHIERNPDTRLVIGGSEAIYPNGRRRTRVPPALPSRPVDRVRAYLIDQTLNISNGACVMHRDVFQRGLYPSHFRNVEDIPVFAQVLASYPCTTLAQSLAYIYKHEDSLRHNLDYGLQVGEKLIAEVFDTQRLPETMQVLRRPFIVKRYLTLFRTFSRAGEKEKAWEFYRQAVKADWRALFSWSYTRKALKLWVLGR